MKKLLMATAMAAVAAMPAMAGTLATPILENQIVAPAAPMAPAPVADVQFDDWGGFYFGGGIGSISQDTPDGSDIDLDLRAGYNFDLGDVVLGAEAVYAPLGVELDSGVGDMKGSFSLKGRAGYDMGTLLPYVSLGIKSAKADFGAGELSDTGTAFGVGVDYKMSPGMTLGGELTKTSFDDFDGTGNDIDQTQFGVNMKVSF